MCKWRYCFWYGIEFIVKNENLVCFGKGVGILGYYSGNISYKSELIIAFKKRHYLNNRIHV